MARPLAHYVRRTHLYLALFALPWFVMYGVSALAFSHPGLFEEGPNLYNPASGAWTEEGTWPCSLAVPAEGQIDRDLAERMLEIAGLEPDAYETYPRSPNRLDVHKVAFWDAWRLSYHVDEQRLVLHSRKVYPQHALTGMHVRSGYHHRGVLNDAWAVMVDVVSVGFLLWVVTGLIVWWQLPRMRWWGMAGLAAGALSFVLLLLAL